MPAYYSGSALRNKAIAGGASDIEPFSQFRSPYLHDDGGYKTALLILNFNSEF